MSDRTCRRCGHPGLHPTLAYRYLGAEIGDLYLAATAADAPHSVVFRMAPEHWRTTDYAKQFG